MTTRPPVRRPHPATPTLVVLLLAAAADGQWPHWGGPGGDFQAEPVALDTAWGEEGPRRLWSRDLGDGYSAISVDGGLLYTMYRPDDDTEVVVALDAATGATRWEHRYPASIDGLNTDQGKGPHSTPLVIDGRVFTVGIRSRLLCLDAASGDVVWSRDLWQEFDAQPPGRGFSSSPIAWGDYVILPVGGGDGHGVVAFHRSDGRIAWHSLDDGPTFSSPIVVEADGRAQLVVLLSTRVVGLAPATGALLWSHPHPTQYNVNAATPVWGPGNHVFTSSAYDAGSRVVRLVRSDTGTQASEVWYDRTMKIHHGTAVRQGEMVYGSSGDFGPAFLMGAHVPTGKLTDKQRGFAKANLLGVGELLIVLDEQGVLGIVRPGLEGFDVLARAPLLTTRSWTVPTLVGTTLYARDQQRIVAVDLTPR